MCFFSLTFLHLRCVYTHSCLFLYLGHFCFSYYFTSISVIPLLLPLSRFSRVWLCGTPQTAVHQAPPSLGFSRQEHWSGLPFPSPMHESEKWKWSHSVVSDSGTLWTAAYQAPPSMGFSMARLLEWGAIAFFPVIPLIQYKISSVQFTSVTQSYPTLCNTMDCSMPGIHVHHQLPEFTQTHVHWVGDAIQPSHPLLSPSPPTFNLSQHQGLFK